MTSTESLQSCSSSPLSLSASSPSSSVPGCSSIQAHRGRAHTSFHKTHRPTRSLSILNKLPRDFSSFISSHNRARQNSPALLDKDIQSQRLQLVSEGYAHCNRHKENRPVRNKSMFAPQQSIQPVKKTENRIYHFFRSRSRSRSKSERFTPEQATPVVPILNVHDCSSSLDPEACSSAIKSSPKPSTRSQSRPISSTTTATHSTITPLPSSSLRGRYRPDPLYVPAASSSVCISETSHNHHEDATRQGSETSSRPSSTRRKLSSFFGISISSPRKLSFSSRPGTPKLRDHAPQCPHLPSAPSVYHVTADSNTPPQTLRYEDERPSRSISPSPSNKDKGKRPWLPPKFRASSDSRPKSDFISSSLPSSPYLLSSFNHTRTNGGHATPTPESLSDIVEGRTTPTVVAPQPIRAGDIPQIIHTPPTPQRSVTSPPRLIDKTEMDDAYSLLSSTQQQPSADTPQVAQRHNSGQNRIRQRDGFKSPMGFPSPKLFGGRELAEEKAKDKIRSQTKIDGSDKVSPPADVRLTRDASVVVGPPKNMSRRNKHASFDFERPISGGSGLSRNGSILHLGLGLYQSRNGSRGANLERKLSSSSRKSRKNGDGEARQPSPPTSPRSFQTTPPESPLLSPLTPDLTGISVASSQAQSFSTTQSKSNLSSRSASKPPAGQSSSLGRSGGKRAQRVSVGLSHGPFAFEPAAASTTSTLSELARQENSSGDSGGGGHKRAKGRSLDLGLGLAWAPTKLREDIIMPSFVNTRGRVKTPRRQGFLQPKAPSDVTEIFKNVLSDTAYASFKRYVHHFDAHAIPFDGPTGLLTRVEKLLNSAHGLKDNEKQELLSSFAQVVRQNS